ncbi:MAG: DUF1987 domain-containing protein [Bacteroidetes bacterium]|nr:DUF1987 domain-containing protein [Bacteroidota bacterium]
MENLQIKATSKTPGVFFDAKKGTLEIEGRLIPYDAKAFYKTLFDWIDQYCENPAAKTVVKFYFEFLNTPSKKSIMDILRKLEKLYKKGNDVKVLWQYDEDDEDSMEEGHDFGSILSIPFEVIKRT